MPGFGKAPTCNYVVSHDNQILCYDSLSISLSTVLRFHYREELQTTFIKPIDLVVEKNNQTSMDDGVKLSMLSAPLSVLFLLCQEL